MTLPLIPMHDDGSEREATPPCTLDEVRRAALAHLGPRAEALSYEHHAVADAVKVASPATGQSFLITAYTMTEGSWQGYLREMLDKLALPSTASGAGSEQAAASHEPSD